MRSVGFTKQNGTSVTVSFGEKNMGELQACVMRPGNDGLWHPRSLSLSAVCADVSGVQVEWRLEEQNLGVVLDLSGCNGVYRGHLSASGNGNAIIRVVWEVPAGENDFPFVPSFMYGYNEGGKSPGASYPRLLRDEQFAWARPWAVDEWLVRADRSSHCLSSIIKEDCACAIGGRDVCRYEDGSVAQKTGLGISSTEPRRISFSLGYANIPYAHSVLFGRNHSRSEDFVDLDKGNVWSDFFLILVEHDARRLAASKILRESYEILHDSVPDVRNVSEAVCSISEALCDYGFCPDAHLFYMMRGDVNGTDYYQPDFFCTAWAGGLRTAYPLLLAGHQLGNQRWLNIARDVCQNVAVNGVCHKTGLFYENYDHTRKEWSTKGWWSDILDNPGHSGYVNGQCCHYMLLMYMAERDSGVEYPDWLTSAKTVLDHVADVQGENFEFGYLYNEDDGSILDSDGFAGCWFVPGFVTLYRITGDTRYLNTAVHAMDFYREYVDAFCAYGSPHDTFKCPDEEGILAWIEAARLLHEVTGDEKYLQDLVSGLEYEFSWKFAYNVVNQLEPLKSMNWCSTGGSVTSASNAHVHPMGSQILTSMLYATEMTEDPYIRSRLADTSRWTLTTYLRHDGDYGWGKKGMICERFCHTDAVVLERYPDGSPASTWFCMFPWASGAVLEGLTGRILDMSKTNPEVVF